MKKICFFTGTRAEYYLLRPLMRAVDADPGFIMQVLVSGTHLSHEHGYTAKGIEDDGFTIDERVEILPCSDTAVGVCKSAGLGLIGFAEALNRLSPDMVVVLGDRYETFAAASAACMLDLYLIHIHGGESTQGAIDDVLRHAVTKMSHLHFVANEFYGQRLVQMGERPETVVVCGALGLSTLDDIEYMSADELEKDIGFSFAGPTMLITFHPVTRHHDNGTSQVQELVKALAGFPGVNMLITGINADAGGRTLSQLIETFAKEHRGVVRMVENLGQRRYFSAIRCASCLVGNSSSGIIEAPSFGIPVVNIGDRQLGRLQGENVINAEPNADSIFAACTRALSEEFRLKAREVKNPYARPDTISTILNRLKAVGRLTTIKPFYDM